MKFKYFIIASGIVLSIVIEVYGKEPNFWYALWAIMPYIAYAAAASKTKSTTAIIGAGSLILGIDVFIHIQVFFFPGSSTDAIALLTLPFWLSVIIMPLGFLVGWLVEKMIQKMGENGRRY